MFSGLLECNISLTLKTTPLTFSEMIWCVLFIFNSQKKKKDIPKLLYFMLKTTCIAALKVRWRIWLWMNGRQYQAKTQVNSNEITCLYYIYFTTCMTQLAFHHLKTWMKGIEVNQALNTTNTTNSKIILSFISNMANFMMGWSVTHVNLIFTQLNKLHEVICVFTQQLVHLLFL